MPSEMEREYYRRREAQERAAAEKAGQAATGAHTELADRYAVLARDEAAPIPDAASDD